MTTFKITLAGALALAGAALTSSEAPAFARIGKVMEGPRMEREMLRMDRVPRMDRAIIGKVVEGGPRMERELPRMDRMVVRRDLLRIW